MKSKELSVQDLLKPRYLVVADYPGNIVPVNEILMPRKNNDIQLWSGRLDKHPHLFRKLSWHELRSVEEMPEYLKAINQDFICKPIYHPGDVGLFYINEDEADQLLTMEFLPSNKTEYEQYLQTKTKAK